jgi:hypothetical protein
VPHDRLFTVHTPSNPPKPPTTDLTSGVSAAPRRTATARHGDGRRRTAARRTAARRHGGRQLGGTALGGRRPGAHRKPGLARELGPATGYFLFTPPRTTQAPTTADPKYKSRLRATWSAARQLGAWQLGGSPAWRTAPRQLPGPPADGDLAGGGRDAAPGPGEHAGLGDSHRLRLADRKGEESRTGGRQLSGSRTAHGITAAHGGTAAYGGGRSAARQHGGSAAYANSAAYGGVRGSAGVRRHT